MLPVLNSGAIYSVGSKVKRLGALNMRICTFSISDQPDIGSNADLDLWEHYYEMKGLTVYRCRSSFSQPTNERCLVLPELNSNHEDNRSLMRLLLEPTPSLTDTNITELVLCIATPIYNRLKVFLNSNNITSLHLNGFLSYPLSIGFAAACARLASEDNIMIVARDHDFIWERWMSAYPFYCQQVMKFLLPNHQNIRHVVLTNYAARKLRDHVSNIDSHIVPNLFDFGVNVEAHRPHELRDHIGVFANDVLILQPSRCNPAKGTHHVVHLAEALSRATERRVVVVVSGGVAPTTDMYNSTARYAAAIQQLADEHEVELMFLGGKLSPCIHPDTSGRFCINDAYLAANLVAFPGAAEGFGRPVVESVVTRRPLFTAIYPVMASEFLPLGFQFVTIPSDPVSTMGADGWSFDIRQNHVDAYTVEKTLLMLDDTSAANREYIGQNWSIGYEHYSTDPANLHRYLGPVVDWLRTRHGITS